jgi:hypothetical protein
VKKYLTEEGEGDEGGGGGGGGKTQAHTTKILKKIDKGSHCGEKGTR